MRVSQFEIYRLVQRALEGSGAPYGVDRDGAQAVAWLESRGLPGLRLLQEDLPLLEGRFTGLALTRNAEDIEIDAAGISAIAYGSAVIDLARDGSDAPPPSLPLAAVPAARGRRGGRCRSKSAGGRFSAPPMRDAGAILWVGDGEALLDSAADRGRDPPRRPRRRPRGPFSIPPSSRGATRSPSPRASRSMTRSGAGSMPWPPASRCRPAPNRASRGRAAATRTPERAAIPAGRAGAGRR